MASRIVSRTTRPILLTLMLLGVAWEPALSADKKKKAASTKRPAVGVSVAETGRMLRKTKLGKWLLVKKGEKVLAGDLLMAGTGAAIENSAGTVKVSFLGDLHGTSPLPIIETALILNKNRDVDMDVTLDRGRIDVTNTKESGSATVRVQVRNKHADLTLLEPGTRFALEVYGRWPRGVPFEKQPKPGHEPGAEIILLVLKGSVDVKAATTTHHLTAPPGPALIEMDVVHGLDPTPQRLEKVPEWARSDGKETDEVKKRKAAFAKFRKSVLKNGIDKSLDEFAESEDPACRRLAVFVMGALDDLDRLGNVLGNAKHQDVWDNGVRALRHWIGRGPGQDQILYQLLQEKRGYSPAHAAIVMHLLHSFGDDDLARPETYELLIGYLGHEKLAIRGLAHWHLVRLVPAGQKIAYDPLGDAVSRDKAQAEWRKLIPAGELPPKAKVQK